jgi:anti-sigma factor RsiW
MPDRKADVPSAEELSAYLDGALSAAQASRIEAYLATHASEAARVDSYRRQDTRLRTTFDPLRPENPPPELAALTAKLSTNLVRHRRMRNAARYAAVAVLCVSTAAAGRWSADVVPGYDDSTVVAQSRLAADAYRLVTGHPDQRNALDQSANPAELGDFLGEGDSKIHIPRLQLLGYRQIGGQVLPTGAGPAVQLIYNDEKKGPFSLYVARAPDCMRAKPRYTRDGDLSLMSWCRNRAVFMLIGKLDRPAMNWIVDAVNQPDASGSEPEDEAPQASVAPQAAIKPQPVMTPQTVEPPQAVQAPQAAGGASPIERAVTIKDER